MNYDFSYSQNGPSSSMAQSGHSSMSHTSGMYPQPDLSTGGKRPRPLPNPPPPSTTKPSYPSQSSVTSNYGTAPAMNAAKKKKLGPPGPSQPPHPGSMGSGGHTGGYPHSMPSSSMGGSVPSTMMPGGAPSLGLSTGDPKLKMKKKGKGGSSCHQCKSRRNFTALTYCTSNLDKKNKSCRKKFCEHCLKKFYKESPAGIPDKNNWRCPSCRKICCCAACRRRKQRESGPMTSSSSSSANPSSKTVTPKKGPPMKSSGPGPHSSYSGPAGHGPHGHMHPPHSLNHGPHPHHGPHGPPPHPHHPHGPHGPMYMDPHNSHSQHPNHSMHGPHSHPHMHHPHHGGPSQHPPPPLYPPPPNHPHAPSNLLSLGPSVKVESPHGYGMMSSNSMDPLVLNGHNIAHSGMPHSYSPHNNYSPEYANGDPLSAMPSLHLRNDDEHDSDSNSDDSDDDDDDDDSSSSYSASQNEEMNAQRQIEHEQQITVLFTFSQTPRVKKHIKYIKARKDLTDPQKVEAIADLLRGGIES